MDSDLETLQQILQAATEGLSDEQRKWEAQGKWSIAQVLEHLYLTYTGTIRGFERMMKSGKPLASAPSTKQRLQSLVVFGLNYMPSGRKAPQQTTPRGLAMELVTAEMQGKIAAMDEIICECERRFGTGRMLDHPILGPLTGKQWRRFHLIHGRHHAKQIARMRGQMRETVSSTSAS